MGIESPRSFASVYNPHLVTTPFLSTSNARLSPEAQLFTSRVRASFVLGAIGDALGAGVEFRKLPEIRRLFGPRGVEAAHGYPRNDYGLKGAITDDTQMTLFTAEGLIRAWVRGRERGTCHPPSVVHNAYLRWLHTQTESPRRNHPVTGSSAPTRSRGARPSNAEVPVTGLTDGEPDLLDGWLITKRFLHASRVPGNTCLSALRSGEMGTVTERLNDSKGCGGIMRAAPAGFTRPPVRWERAEGAWFVAGVSSQEEGAESVFELGRDLAAITHSHPSGYLSAGALAAAIHHLCRGAVLSRAIEFAQETLARQRGHEETTAILDRARRLAETRPGSAEALESLGGGWVDEEALAIAVYAALSHPSDPVAALLLAINHSGDSDSTGSICGNLLGAALSEDALANLPPVWLADLEGRETIERLASDLAAQMLGTAPIGFQGYGEPEPGFEEWWEKYPGW